MLVVGSGNSGAEIAVDLAEGGASEVLLSVRTPPGIVRRDTLGVPSQLLGIASMHLPTAVVDRLAAGIRRVAIPDLAPYGLVAPARPYSEFLDRRVIPIVDVGLADAVRSGRVRVVAALERFDDGAAVLADGTTDRDGRGRSPRPASAPVSSVSSDTSASSTSAAGRSCGRRGARRRARTALRRLRDHSRRHASARRHRGEAASPEPSPPHGPVRLPPRERIWSKRDDACATGAAPVAHATEALGRRLDDDERVAVRVAQPEHRRHGPAEAGDLFVDVDAGSLQRGVVCVDVRGVEADPRLAAAGRLALRRRGERDRRRRSGAPRPRPSACPPIGMSTTFSKPSVST